MARFLSVARASGERGFTAFFAAGLTVFLILGTTLIIDRQEIARYQEATRTQVVEQLAELNAAISTAMEERLSLLDGIVNLTSVQKRLDQATFESLATAVAEELPDLQAVMLGRKGEVTHLHPYRTDRILDRVALAALPPMAATLSPEPYKERDDWLIGPLELLVGQNSLLVGHPIYPTPPGRPPASGNFWGQGMMLLDVEAFLKAAGLPQAGQPTQAVNGRLSLALGLRLTGPDAAQVHLRGDEELFGKGGAVTQEVTMPGGDWTVAALPADGWPEISPNSWWLRLAGIGFAVFFAGLVFLVIGGAATRIWYGGQLVIGFGIAWLMKRELAVDLLALQPDMVPTAYQVIASGWWLSVAFFVNSGLDAMLWRRIAARSGEPVPKFLTDMVAVIIYLAAIAIVVRYVYDESVTGILATSGLFALVLGLSAQATLGEAFSGIALALAPSYRRGQDVRIGDVGGRVIDMNWRTVTLRTADGNMITLPNSMVSKNIVVNMTEPDGRQRIPLDFFADYHAPPAKVCEVVEKALYDCEELDPNTAPEVRLAGFADTGAAYTAYLWLANGKSDVRARKQGNTLIWHALTNADIPFAFNRQAAYGAMVGEDIPAARPRATWSTAAPRLRDLFKENPLFNVLSDTEVDQLSRSLIAHHYGPPQRIVTQGEEGEDMFVIARGEVVVSIEGSDGTPIEMARHGPGDVFGGMSMLTGERRSATVRAVTDVVLYVFATETMREIFTNRPGLTASFAERIAEYRQQNAAALEQHGRDLAQEQVPKTLLDRITRLLQERWL